MKASLPPLLLTLLVCAATTAAASVVGDRPGPLPRDEVIVFQRTARSAQGGSQIWAMYGGGRTQFEISQTPPGALDRAPSLSRGDGVVVWQRTQAGKTQIAMGNVIGDGLPRVLTHFARGAFSPSVARTLQVVFSVGTGADCELWVMHFDGRDQHRLTDHGGRPGCDSAPVWSPDWREVAFRRTLTDATGHPLSSRELVVSARGGRPRPLAVGPYPPLAVSWAPGDELLVLADSVPRALEAIDPRTGRARVLLRSRDLVGTPVWAPLGTYAAFEERQPDGGSDLFSVTSTGYAIRRLTHAEGFSASHPSWGYPVDQGSEPGPGVHARSLGPGRRSRR